MSNFHAAHATFRQHEGKCGDDMTAVLLGAVMLYAAMIAPVRVRCDVFWHGQAEVDIWARIWGLPLGQSLSLGRDAFIRMLPAHAPAEDDAMRRRLASVGAVLRGDGARRYLARHVRIVQLDAKVNLSMQDAARTAVASGLLQWAAQAVYTLAKGRARIAVVPEFYAERSAAEARCILFFRLGHMIYVCMAALAAWLLERREHGLTHASKEA